MIIGCDIRGVEGDSLKPNPRSMVDAIQELHRRCEQIEDIANFLKKIEGKVCGMVEVIEDEVGEEFPITPSGLVEELDCVSRLLDISFRRIRQSSSTIDNTLGE